MNNMKEWKLVHKKFIDSLTPKQNEYYRLFIIIEQTTIKELNDKISELERRLKKVEGN